MKMNLQNNFSVTVVLGFMLFALTQAAKCKIEPQKDSRCEAYVVISDKSESCYIHYTNMPDFWVRKNISLTKAIFDIIELNFTRKSENDNTNIIESISETWTRIEPVSSQEKEPNAYTIGNTKIFVPESFTKYKVYIWILGSVIFTNDSKCLSESHNTTPAQSTDIYHLSTSQSADSTYMTTTQSTDSAYLTTTQSNHAQTTHPSKGEATAGPSQQWWLYVIIGILLIVVLTLVVFMILQMKRNKLKVGDTMKLGLKNDDASTLIIHSQAPQIPDFYGNGGGTFEKNARAEENIYEEPEMYNIPYIYENGKEYPYGQAVPSDLGTRRGSSHESENSLYGCITGRDLQA